MISPVILVGRTRRWNVVRDLRTACMWPCQCAGDADAAAGNLYANRVRMSERRSDGDCGGTKFPDRGDNGSL